MMLANHHPRDLLAFDKISVTQPFWRGFETAKSQIGIEENVFLHAGPAFTTVDEICQPIINSAAVGAVFEGLAKSLDDAVNMVRSGEIILKPAQDHNVVTPLAAVVTPNMPLHYVYDGNHGNHYCLTPINGGNGPAILLGQKSYEAVEHLHWINGPMLDFMASSLGEGIELIPGYKKEERINKPILGGKAPLYDRLQNPDGIQKVSNHWRPQFSFPIQNVPDERLKETLYYLDYQGVRFISLDSNIEMEIQVDWLRKVLEENDNRWTIITFHHPLYSPASERDNFEMRQLWKPLLDEFKVDLVLSGHDHSYSRTGVIDAKKIENIPTGYQQAYDPEIGTVHVVSVSGPKMYEITKGKYAKKLGENTQLYQIIDINKDNLRFRAYTATGKLYDEFLLKKRIDQPNLLIETNF